MKQKNYQRWSRWLLLTLLTLLVGVSPAWADAVTDDFTSYSATSSGQTLGDNWYVYPGDDGSYGRWGSDYTYKHNDYDGADANYVSGYSSNYTKNVWLVLKKEVSGTVSFRSKMSSSTGTIYVTNKVTSVGDGTFTVDKVGAQSYDITTSTSSNNYNAGDASYIAFCIASSNLRLLDVTYTEYVETYKKPATFTISSITTEDATASWTAGSGDDSEIGWDLEYKKASADTWTEVHDIAKATTSYDFTSLESNTTYDVRVRALYAESHESDWKTGTFKTLRAPITSYPWSEDFTGLASGIPDGWDNTEGTTTSASYKWTYVNSGHTASPCLRFDSYNNYTNNTNFLKTPAMSYAQNAPMQLKFWYKNPTGGDFSVYISNDGGATYTEELASGLTGATSWTEKVIDLPTNEYYNNVVIVFKGTSNYGSGDAYIYLDDVLVKENSAYGMSVSGDDVSENTIAFGTVKNTTTTKTFTINNDGSGDLTNVSVVSSDDTKFTVSDTGFDIAAGAKKDITVTFVKEEEENYSETITISQANIATPIELTVTATYQAPTPATIAVKLNDVAVGASVPFGTVGKAKTKTFTVANTGEATLNITSIVSSNTTDFTVSPASLDIAGGETGEFTVTFVWDGDALNAEKTANITVTSSNAGLDPIVFAITGTRDNLWSEDFEGVNPLNGWENSGFTVKNQAYLGSTNNGTTLPSKFVVSNYSATASTLITPCLEATAGDKLSFDAYFAWGDETLKVEWSEDKNNWHTDAPLYNYDKSSYSNGEYHTIEITAPITGSFYLRFSATYSNAIDNIEGFKRVQAPEFSVYSDDTYANEKKVTMAESTDFGFVDEEKTTAYYIKNTGLSAMSLAAPVAQSPLTASFSDASVGVTETGEGDAKRWNIPVDGTIKLNITMSNTAAGQYTDKTVTVTADDEVGTFVASYSGIVTDANHYNIDFATAAIPNDWTDDGEYSNWTKNNEGYISTTGSSNLTTSALVATTGEKLYIQRDGNALTIKYKKLADENFSNLQALAYTSKKKIDEITMPDGLAADKILLQFSGTSAKIYRIYGLAEPHEPKMAVAPADDSYDFGMQTAATSQEFIVTNSGNADLEGVTAELTGDDAADYQVALSIPDGSSATINENVATVPAGQTLKVTATLKASTEFKEHNATLTIASTSEGIVEKAIALTGKTRDVAKQYVEFATEIPNGWTSNGWSVTSGEAKATNGTLRTTPLTIAANETMAVDARISNSNSGSLKVRYTTNNGVDWQETTIPAVYNYTTCSTYTFNLGNTENAVTAFIEFVGENAVIDNFYGGVATTAPLLEVTENTSAVANNDDFDFGSNLQAEPAAKVFTLANKGNASMNVTIAKTGDVTVTPAAATIAAGETADVTVSLPYDQAYVGDKTGTVTITFGTAEFTLNFTGNTIDPTALNEELASLPAGWYNAGWTVNGTANIYSGVEQELITEQYAAEAGKNVLSFKAKAQSGNEGTLKVYTSTDRKTWSEPTEFTLTSEYANKSLTALADGNYYVKFVSMNANIDDLVGLKKVTGIGHDLYVSASNIPAETKVPGTEITATATVYSLRDAETGVYAKLLFGDAVVATATAEDISLNGSKDFTLTGNVPAEEGTYAAKIVVYYSDNSVASETAATDVKVEHTRTLAIQSFVRDGEGAMDADVNNQISPAFKVTVKNTGTTALTPIIKVKQGETVVGTTTGTELAADATSEEITVNATNMSAGEGGNLNFTAEAYWSSETDATAFAYETPVVITVNAAAPKFELADANANQMTDGAEVAFGLVRAAATKTYTITNSGTAALELVSITAPDGYEATALTADNKTIAANGTLNIDVTLKAEQGKKSGDLEITYKVDATTNNTFTLALSGRSIAANTWTEDFATGIPATWQNTGWTVEEGVAYSGGTETTQTLMTPRLAATNGEVLTYDATFKYTGYTLKVEYSTDKTNWTEYATVSDATDGEQSFTAPADGNYYLRFTGTRYAQLDNFVGFRENPLDHDTEIAAATVPATGTQYGTYTATVTLKENVGKAEGISAKLFVGGTDVNATVDNTTLTANGSTVVTLTWKPQAVIETAVKAYVQVTLDDATDIVLKTAEVDLTIAAPFTLSDTEAPTFADATTTYEALVLNREFVEGWNTVCLPFTITDIEAFFGAGAKAYTLSSYADNTLKFQSVVTMNASYPYVVYVPAAIASGKVVENVEIGSAFTTPSTTATYFVGTYAPINDMTGKWGIATIDGKAKIAKGKSGSHMNGFRAYFALPATTSGAPAMMFDGEIVTGISAIEMAAEEGERIYNVNGQRVMNPKKGGMYIVGGKKVVVK